MTDTPESHATMLDRAVDRAKFSVADIARAAGIKSAQLKKYRAGETEIPGVLLRQTLPAALRNHARTLMGMAAELEAVPLPVSERRPTIRTQLIAEVMKLVEKEEAGGEADG